MSVKGLKADGDVHNSHGRLAVSDARAGSGWRTPSAPWRWPASTETSRSPTRTAPSASPRFKGPLDVSNRFASVEARSVRKGAVVVNSNGSVLLADAGGPSRITNSFGTVEASLVRGDLAVLNGNGNVSVRA